MQPQSPPPPWHSSHGCPVPCPLVLPFLAAHSLGFLTLSCLPHKQGHVHVTPSPILPPPLCLLQAFIRSRWGSAPASGHEQAGDGAPGRLPDTLAAILPPSITTATEMIAAIEAGTLDVTELAKQLGPENHHHHQQQQLQQQWALSHLGSPLSHEPAPAPAMPNFLQLGQPAEVCKDPSPRAERARGQGPCRQAVTPRDVWAAVTGAGPSPRHGPPTPAQTRPLPDLLRAGGAAAAGARLGPVLDVGLEQGPDPDPGPGPGLACRAPPTPLGPVPPASSPALRHTRPVHLGVSSQPSLPPLSVITPAVMPSWEATARALGLLPAVAPAPQAAPQSQDAGPQAEAGTAVGLLPESVEGAEPGWPSADAKQSVQSQGQAEPAVDMAPGQGKRRSSEAGSQGATGPASHRAKRARTEQGPGIQATAASAAMPEGSPAVTRSAARRQQQQP